MAVALAAVVGLLLAGAGAGHVLWPQQTVRDAGAAASGGASDADAPAPAPAQTGAAGPAQEPVAMPDILGLPEGAARQVLTDYNITDAVTTTTRQAAGPTGLVVEQNPPVGSAPGPVSLTLSSAVPLPAVKGRPFTEVRDQLEKLGAIVLVTRRVRPGTAVGSVISSTPEVGESIPSQVELTIADPGEILLWGNMRQADQVGCSVFDANAGRPAISVAGTSAASGVRCRPSTSGDSRYVDVVLGGHAQLFVVTLGLDDADKRDGTTVSIYGDDLTSPLKTVKVIFGKATELSVPVRGVIRLRVQVNPTTSKSPGIVVFGNAGVLGDPAELSLARVS